MATPLRLALALALVASLPAAASEPVALTFAWPAGQQLEVAYALERHAEGGDGERTHRVAARYTIETAAREDGLAIHHGPVQLDPQSGSAGGADPRSDFFAAVAGLPDYRVDASGRTLVFLESEAFVEASRTRMAAAVETLPPQARELARRLLDPEGEMRRLEARTRASWLRRVGSFAGRTLGPEWQEAPTSGIPLRALGHFEVPVKRRVRLLGRRPCGEKKEAESPPRCVLLEVESTVDPARLAQAIANHFGAVGGQERISVEFTQRSRILTESDTLVPLHETVETDYRVDVARGEGGHALTRRDRRTTTWRVAAPGLETSPGR